MTVAALMQHSRAIRSRMIKCFTMLWWIAASCARQNKDDLSHFFPRAIFERAGRFVKLLSCISFGALAQLGERLVCNQEVAGSIPVRSIQFARLPPRRCRFAPPIA